MGTNINMHLSLAAFLVARKEKYIIVRYSPESDSLLKNKYSFTTNWHYVVLADDFNGNGLDNGFVKSAVPYAVYRIDSPYQAEQLSEDTLEEEYSNVTVMGLKENSMERLRAFLQSDIKPALQIFLDDSEIFINIVCGKQYGFFNSFLAKSRIEIQGEFDKFKSVTDAET